MNTMFLNGCIGNHQVRKNMHNGSTIHRHDNYSSGLVFTKETTRSPSFHWPRFLKSSTRSNRFRTLRLTANPPGGLKLGCLLISYSNVAFYSYVARKKLEESCTKQGFRLVQGHDQAHHLWIWRPISRLPCSHLPLLFPVD